MIAQFDPTQPGELFTGLVNKPSQTVAPATVPHLGCGLRIRPATGLPPAPGLSQPRSVLLNLAAWFTCGGGLPAWPMADVRIADLERLVKDLAGLTPVPPGVPVACFWNLQEAHFDVPVRPGAWAKGQSGGSPLLFSRSEPPRPVAASVSAFESPEFYPGVDFVLRLYLRDLAANISAGPAPNAPSTSATETISGTAGQDRERLVTANLRGVVGIAFEYQGLGLSLGDLINEGNLGLIRAAERFDPLRGMRFASYAKDWIRVYMRRALSYQAWPVSLPADFHWRRSQVRNAEERLTATLHREPGDEELARECRLPTCTVHRLRSAPIPSVVTFDSPLPEDEDGLTLAETLPDETAPKPDVEAVRHSDGEFVEDLLTVLTPRERRVIRLRFGLDGGCEHTLEEVGRLLGYVRQGIHRLECAALAKLRQRARFLELTRVDSARNTEPVKRSAVARLEPAGAACNEDQRDKTIGQSGHRL